MNSGAPGPVGNPSSMQATSNSVETTRNVMEDGSIVAITVPIPAFAWYRVHLEPPLSDTVTFSPVKHENDSRSIGPCISQAICDWTRAGLTSRPSSVHY